MKPRLKEKAGRVSAGFFGSLKSVLSGMEFFPGSDYFIRLFPGNLPAGESLIQNFIQSGFILNSGKSPQNSPSGGLLVV